MGICSSHHAGAQPLRQPRGYKLTKINATYNRWKEMKNTLTASVHTKCRLLRFKSVIDEKTHQNNLVRPSRGLPPKINYRNFGCKNRRAVTQISLAKHTAPRPAVSRHVAHGFDDANRISRTTNKARALGQPQRNIQNPHPSWDSKLLAAEAQTLPP